MQRKVGQWTQRGRTFLWFQRRCQRFQIVLSHEQSDSVQDELISAGFVWKYDARRVYETRLRVNDTTDDGAERGDTNITRMMCSTSWMQVFTSSIFVFSEDLLSNKTWDQRHFKMLAGCFERSGQQKLPHNTQIRCQHREFDSTCNNTSTSEHDTEDALVVTYSGATSPLAGISISLVTRDQMSIHENWQF